MVAVVQIAGAGVPDAMLQQEALALAGLLRRQPELSVEHPQTGPPARGERGSVLELGKLLVSFVTPDAAGVLAEGLKHYFARSPEFSVAITAESGARIELTATNLAPERLAETAERLRALLAARP